MVISRLQAVADWISPVRTWSDECHDTHLHSGFKLNHGKAWAATTTTGFPTLECIVIVIKTWEKSC